MTYVVYPAPPGQMPVQCFPSMGPYMQGYPMMQPMQPMQSMQPLPVPPAVQKAFQKEKEQLSDLKPKAPLLASNGEEDKETSPVNEDLL
jgi:hypothetical protein